MKIQLLIIYEIFDTEFVKISQAVWVAFKKEVWAETSSNATQLLDFQKLLLYSTIVWVALNPDFEITSIDGTHSPVK